MLTLQVNVVVPGQQVPWETLADEAAAREASE